MHKNVEVLIGRLATDPQLRRSFAEDPDACLEAQRELGFELTPVELEALAATAPEAFETFALALDPRLRRAPRPAASSTIPTFNEQEIQS